MFSRIKATGLIADEIPRTIRILKILDPTAFPTAISTSFFLAATTEVTSSGSEVPIDTMVSPTRVWLIPSSIAILLAVSTVRSPPKAIAAAPTIRKRILLPYDSSFILSHSSTPSISIFCPAARAFIALRTIVKIYPANTIRKITPSACPSVIPALSPSPEIPSTSRNSAQPKDKGISLTTVAFWTIIGVRIEQTPITNIRLKILDPTTLLTASSLFCTREAVTLTAVSGSEVPIATIVRPMMMGGTFNFFAMLELPSTKKSAPFTRKANPTASSRITAAIGNPLIIFCIILSFCYPHIFIFTDSPECV